MLIRDSRGQRDGWAGTANRAVAFHCLPLLGGPWALGPTHRWVACRRAVPSSQPCRRFDPPPLVSEPPSSPARIKIGHVQQLVRSRVPSILTLVRRRFKSCAPLRIIRTVSSKPDAD